MVNIDELAGTYDKITSSQSLSYGGFNSNLKFTTPQKGDDFYYIGKKSYMSIQFKIIQTRDDVLIGYNLDQL